MTNQIVASSNIESAVIDGDLSRLTPEQRVSYYQSVCKSIGINPLTRPFNYITLNGKLTLYATRNASDQLRKIHNVSIDDVNISMDSENITVIVKGHDAVGRSDVEIGVVSKKDMQGNIGNVTMKAVTKAKRRLTLSLCGLGWTDESEIETIPTAKPVNVNIDTGEVIEAEVQPSGNGSKPNTGTIDLIRARAIVGSDGKTYGECTKEELTFKRKAIIKKLGTPVDNATQSALQEKLDAIMLLLAEGEAQA